LVALSNRNYALLWSGALLSNVGTWMQLVAVPYVIFQLTHSAALVGLAAFVSFAPGFLGGPLAGSLADRIDRKQLILLSQSVQLALAVALWAVWVGGQRSVGVILALVSVGGLAQALTMPSWQAFISELVPREHLLNAITLNSAQFNGARAIGPAIAGLVLAHFGPSWAFLANAISYLAVIAALVLIRRPITGRQPRPRQRVMGEFREALHYVRRHPGLLVAIGLVSLIALLGMPVFQLTAVFARRVYHVGATRFGLLTAAYGTGSVVGAVIIGLFGSRFRRSRMAIAAVVLYAVGLTGLGLVRSYPVAIFLLALCGLAFLCTGATLLTSIQLIVGEAVRGRVLAVYTMAINLAFPLGSLAQGWLSDRLAVTTVVLGAGVAMTVLAVVLGLRPELVVGLDGHTHRVGVVLPDTMAEPPLTPFTSGGG
jgi:MFS family permease